ncbi:ATP-binding cassette domain-containing protein [Cohnella nanjingensis]|uniref:ATP-binding cassette domain-containing protein n=1 Tax=Cohnella nanjingensis TaxID=1387779 RepID=A0A7X0RSD3_9BACL|nr:ATP-binding cassette domain-containing protein [Cohnella nanjingensis]MBB6672824.1 ATP-binding cassette domain-containing protein [Cohnella nanjingensis]
MDKVIIGSSSVGPGAELHLQRFANRLRQEEEAVARPEASMTLRAGTITVLLGPNGAGKTRLLETVAGLRDPQGAAIAYGEQPLWQSRGGRRPRLRTEALRCYSYACQSPEEQLFARTVEGELRYVLAPFGATEQEVEARMEAAVRAVGWDRSWLGRDPYLLSGGERRRAALACAFAAPAPWLLLDEPTAGLDAHAHALLAAQLSAEKAQGRGVLLVSHDSDWALPLADMVLLMDAAGGIRMCTTEQLLARPSWWLEAGMDIPLWFHAAHAGWRLGLSAGQALDPRLLAARLGSGREAGASSRDRDPFSAVEAEIPHLNVFANTESSDGGTSVSDMPAAPPIQSSARHPLMRFDPRSVWLSYILLSGVLFAIQSWAGLAWGALVTIAAVWLGRIPLRRWRGTLIGFASFTASAAVLAGLTGSGGDGWWHMDAFLATLRAFARTWLVLLLGLGLPLAIPPLRLRRSLEQLLAFRGRMGRRSQQAVLTVTLMLRFIPQLLGEWERFARIAIARGKENAKTPAAMARRLKNTAIPFLLALFRMGDQVSLALESRGVGQEPHPTSAERLRWGGGDVLLFLIVCGICGGLVLGGRLGWF